ncbi:OLC1v1003009C2 [Oldenlandia corymbosa var. corymbosa]|uniref:OLC1v1003009C2 n=1 Tax=Oldenlandia corymbosa var. corymbosa TaxID=529605 RepID=A0AAV1D942_OLDCO|nr:OLC1v1003009C2 [Oldenlandia corymbosa var. corymbosa]
MEARRFNVDDVKNNKHCIHSGQTSADAKPRKKKMPPVETKKKVDLVKPKGAKSKAKKVTQGKAKKSGSIKRRRVGISEVYDDIEAKFSVLERAARVLASLEDEFPFFLKYMLPSNVAYSFWLIIPRKFGALHLPSQDSTVILVDEWGKEFKTTYLIDRNGLSAGWRGFSLAHRLLKGDILIFRLIGPCKLQVHIVRVNGSDVINAAQCLMNMDAIGKTTDSGNFCPLLTSSA